jgi:cytochrome P450
MVSKSFTPSAIAALEPRIEEIANGLLDDMEPENGMDIISDYAEPLPITVIAEMLGIPVEDRKRFKEWSDNIVGVSERQDFASGMRSNWELGRYFGKIIEERRNNAGKDLISSIITSEMDGERLSMSEAVSFCILLLVAGNETTTNLIGNAMRLFAKYNSFRRLQEDRSLLPGAVEEVLRFSSPVRGMFRVALSDTDLSGKSIRAGQSLMAWIGSANRDEPKFPNPERFDLERKPNPHIAFGHGIHLCLGAPLARLEAKVALGSLIERFGGAKLKVPDEELEPISNMVIGGVKHLPVEFVP